MRSPSYRHHRPSWCATRSRVDTYSPFPVRLSNAMKQVVIREKKAQQAKGLHSYDYTATSQGTIEPAPLSDVFIGPNGLSLRPAGRAMCELVTSKRALLRNSVFDWRINKQACVCACVCKRRHARLCWSLFDFFISGDCRPHTPALSSTKPPSGN
jgi:hypothetical protein